MTYETLGAEHVCAQREGVRARTVGSHPFSCGWVRVVPSHVFLPRRAHDLEQAVRRISVVHCGTLSLSTSLCTFNYVHVTWLPPQAGARPGTVQNRR